MTTHPTVGVEEEFLLVDPQSGAPIARNLLVSEHAANHGLNLHLELTSCQVEINTPVLSNSASLRAELLRQRRITAQSAEAVGARLLAAGLPPTLPHEFPVTDKPRYQLIADNFGMLAHEQGMSGCHVHVGVPTREVAIHVSNRLRPWLPMVLALSANSAIYRNSATGYASWRRILFSRWPSAGATPHFDSIDEYDAVVAMLQTTGAALDEGMIYWDVRPSAKYPTVEIRVADVPATVAETVLVATLIRAAVMTALADERLGEGIPRLADHALRAAYWRSARDGLDGGAIDLDSHAVIPARELLSRFVDHLRPALEDLGDYEMVRDELARIVAQGNGAMRQRRAWQRRGDAGDVVEELAAATLAQ